MGDSDRPTEHHDPSINEELAQVKPVFFRKIAPAIGNIQEAVWLDETSYSFFGKDLPCVIIETWGDEE
jgi:hypothetical protein